MSSIKNFGEAPQTKKGTTDVTAANEIADGTLGNRLQLDSFISSSKTELFICAVYQIQS